jgi:hypothetical protein
MRVIPDGAQNRQEPFSNCAVREVVALSAQVPRLRTAPLPEGTSDEGWMRQRAEEALQDTLSDVRRGTWPPPSRSPSRRSHPRADVSRVRERVDRGAWARGPRRPDDRGLQVGTQLPPAPVLQGSPLGDHDSRGRPLQDRESGRGRAQPADHQQDTHPPVAGALARRRVRTDPGQPARGAQAAAQCDTDAASVRRARATDGAARRGGREAHPVRR